MPLTQEDLEAQRQYAEDSGIDADSIRSQPKEALDYLRYRGTPLETEKKKLFEERLQKDLKDANPSTALNRKNNSTTSSIKAPKPTLKITGIPPLREETPAEATDKKIEVLTRAVKELSKAPVDQNVDLAVDGSPVIEPLTAPQEENSSASIPGETPEKESTLKTTTANRVQETSSILPTSIKNSTDLSTPLVEKTETKKEQPEQFTQNITIEQEQQLRNEYPFVDFDRLPKNDEEASQLEQFKKDLLEQLNQKQAPVAAVVSKPTVVTATTDLPATDIDNVPPVPITVPVTAEQRQQLRDEYPFVDFDRQPKNDEEANQLEQFERRLLDQIKNRQAVASNNTTVLQNNLTTFDQATSPASAESLSTNNAPATPSVTIQQEALSEAPVANVEPPTPQPIPLSESISSEPNIQSIEAQNMLEPMEAPVAAATQAPNLEAPAVDTSEQTLKNIMNLNSNTVTVLYTINSTLNEILKNIGNISISTGDGIDNFNKPSNVTTINDGSINMYRGTFRPQNNVSTTQLRPTTPGFTV